MIDTNVSLAASALLAARASGATIPSLPEGSVPRNAAEAYAIQDAVNRSLGPVGGWKVGAKNPDSEPTCAPLPAALIAESPGRFLVEPAQLHGVEIEVAVRLGKDLPPTDQPYTADSVIAAVESVHPAVEIVCSRYTDPWQLNELLPLADAISNGCLVLGPGISDKEILKNEKNWIELNLSGKTALFEEKANPGGSLGRLLAWLANHAAARAGGLRKGDIVTTGSYIGIFPVSPTVEIQGRVRGLGEVAVSMVQSRAGK